MDFLKLFEDPRTLLPVDLRDPGEWPRAFAFTFAFLCVRYFAIAAPFAAFYVPRAFRSLGARRLRSDPPPIGQQLREIAWSLSTTAVFAAVAVGWGWAWQSGWLRLYRRYDEYGWAYLAASPVLLLLLHETYFYWTHRWLHLGWAYRAVHYRHHRSPEPSVWASFSFHPAEALINALALPLIAAALPLHPVVVLVHLTLMTLSAASNHWGAEILPAFVARSWVGERLISGVHHVDHHRRVRCNYGLFLTLWDRWMGTERAGYRERLKEAAG